MAGEQDPLRVKASAGAQPCRPNRSHPHAPPCPPDAAAAAKMQVAPGSDGIQKLLAAEQEAQRIVSEARKGECRRRPHATAAPVNGSGARVGASLLWLCGSWLVVLPPHHS